MQSEFDWLEISVRVDEEAAEAVSELFNRYNRGGAVVEQFYPSDDDGHYNAEHDAEPVLMVKTYLPLTQTETRRQLEEALGHLSHVYPIPAPQFKTLTEKDWAEAWKKDYRPLEVGPRLVIVPSWQTYRPRPGQVTITLDPGMAFGTGLHPTTRLCLEALGQYLPAADDLNRHNQRVLDLGTGSGILAVAAARLGASSVVALDVDPVAVRTARENVVINHLEAAIEVEHGSLERLKLEGAPFDLMVVNILTDTIMRLLEAGLAEHLAANGVLIASGIIEARETEVIGLLESQGIALLERRQEKDWIMLIGRRNLAVGRL
jgi:ribosomal protein L11 methyltransferase